MTSKKARDKKGRFAFFAVAILLNLLTLYNKKLRSLL
jgi:hypothetical protein